MSTTDKQLERKRQRQKRLDTDDLDIETTGGVADVIGEDENDRVRSSSKDNYPNNRLLSLCTLYSNGSNELNVKDKNMAYSMFSENSLFNMFLSHQISEGIKLNPKITRFIMEHGKLLATQYDTITVGNNPSIDDDRKISVNENGDIDDSFSYNEAPTLVSLFMRYWNRNYPTIRITDDSDMNGCFELCYDNSNMLKAAEEAVKSDHSTLSQTEYEILNMNLPKNGHIKIMHTSIGHNMVEEQTEKRVIKDINTKIKSDFISEIPKQVDAIEDRYGKQSSCLKPIYIETENGMNHYDLQNEGKTLEIILKILSYKLPSFHYLDPHTNDEGEIDGYDIDVEDNIYVDEDQRMVI